MKFYIYKFFLLGFVSYMPMLSWGQLNLKADNAIIVPTEYPSGVKQDNIFCFDVGTPMIVRYELNGKDYTIKWYRRSSDNSWGNLFQEGGTSINVATEGGYRIVVTDSSEVVMFDERFWVFNSQSLLEVQAEIIDDNCSKVYLYATAVTNPLYYYDPLDGSAVPLNYGLSFNWTTDPEGEERYGESVSFDAPCEDLNYVVTVTDRFGNSLVDSVEYESIAVKADFIVDTLKVDVSNELHEEFYASAPFELRFIDTSQGNVTAWEWTFGNLGRSIERNPLFVFTEEGQYEIILKVLNRDSGCESIKKDIYVNISESELEVPNVFTPNGDGINDEFRVAYKSLKKFEMVVFNRWGRKVYQSKDPAKGWDGDGHAPGVYFYYIYAEGYNEGEVYKKEGAVHLIRGK